MSSTRTALVLGATGGVGGETAVALARHGWRIRAFARAAKPTPSTAGWEWVSGDALDCAAVVAAARGTSAIVHAVNPPGYRNWSTLVVPMLENTIAAARASGARILLPGTIYNYGADAFPPLREESAQHATTKKGLIRIQMEALLESAAAEGVASLNVRFGDFFGPVSGNNWFSQGLVKPNVPLKSITYPGSKGVGHSWTYIPDAGETFARLMDREAELETFARFHFKGIWDEDGTGMIEAIRRVSGKPSLPVRAMPWFLLKLAAPFHETMRELAATQPLWQTSIQLDNRRLVEFLGAEPHTPIDEAVETTLRGLNCLGQA